jgi:hypothetical protein
MDLSFFFLSDNRAECKTEQEAQLDRRLDEFLVHYMYSGSALVERYSPSPATLSCDRQLLRRTA